MCLANNNIVEEVAWMVGDQPIYKSEIGNRDVEQVLSRLDREVAKRDVYKRLRVARIDSVRHDRRLQRSQSDF